MANLSDVRGHVTIEKHRKSLKFQQLLAFVTLALGITLVVLGVQEQQAGNTTSATLANGSLTTFGGLVWMAVVRFLMWWHHG